MNNQARHRHRQSIHPVGKVTGKRFGTGIGAGRAIKGYRNLPGLDIGHPHHHGLGHARIPGQDVGHQGGGHIDGMLSCSRVAVGN